MILLKPLFHLFISVRYWKAWSTVTPQLGKFSFTFSENGAFKCQVFLDCLRKICVCFCEFARGVVGLSEKPCFMHEGQGWGLFGGGVSRDTQSQISGHHDYLA